MTEKSYFYDGIAPGDAMLAPYNAETYANIRAAFLANGKDVVFDNDPFLSTCLKVIPNAGMTIQSEGGSALLQGVWFYRGGVINLTVSANTSGLPRIDRVVLRVNWNTSTVTTVIKMGQPSVVPQFPPLVQEFGDIYELSLARIYVPNGLAVVTAAHIIDERQVMANPQFAHIYSNDNLFPNSEFIAPAGTNNVPTTGAPATWIQSASVSCVMREKFPSMRRGSTVEVDTSSDAVTRGITNWVKLSNGATLTYTVRFLIEVYEGVVWVDLAGGAGAGAAWITPSQGPVEVIIRSTTTDSLGLFIGRHSSTAVQTTFRLGQVTLAYGNRAADEQAVRETILFGNPLVMLSAATPASVYPSEFLAPGFRDVLLYLQCSDSNGVADVTSYVSIFNNNAVEIRLEMGGEPNNSTRCLQGIFRPTFVTTDLGKNIGRWLPITGTLNGTGTATASLIGCTT